jgi:hypothetical protein
MIDDSYVNGERKSVLIKWTWTVKESAWSQNLGTRAIRSTTHLVTRSTTRSATTLFTNVLKSFSHLHAPLVYVVIETPIWNFGCPSCSVSHALIGTKKRYRFQRLEVLRMDSEEHCWDWKSIVEVRGGLVSSKVVTLKPWLWSGGWRKLAGEFWRNVSTWERGGNFAWRWQFQQWAPLLGEASVSKCWTKASTKVGFWRHAVRVGVAW